MNVSLSSLWSLAAQLGMATPSTPDLALIVLLAATLLVLLAFRENYLKIWIVGWAALIASRMIEHSLISRFPAPFGVVAVQSGFVLAVGLLAGAVLLYSRSRNLLVPLAAITPILVGCAGARVLLAPESLPLRMAVEVSYRILLLTAAVALLRARRGRFEPATWLLAACLPLLYLSWSPFTDRIPVPAALAAEITLGTSLILVVFAESRRRTERLVAMQALTQSIAGAQQYGNVVEPALEKLQHAARVVAKQEFAGYWEYLLDEAIFTAPSHPNWGGTALIGPAGDLLGIGSLQLQHVVDKGQPQNINMIVPIDLLKPILDDLMKTGRRSGPQRPWLGLYATEVENRLVVVGLADRGPAKKADLRNGDIVLSVGGKEVRDLAAFFRRIWAQGQAGVEVPVSVYRDGETIDVRIKSSERGRFLKGPSLH